MQKDSAADIELNLKKKARRRLVGAIAMVALMVILLPILLKDRSAAVTQEDVKISIQNEEVISTEVIAPTPATDFDSSVVPAEKPVAEQPQGETVALPGQAAASQSSELQSVPAKSATLSAAPDKSVPDSEDPEAGIASPPKSAKPVEKSAKPVDMLKEKRF